MLPKWAQLALVLGFVVASVWGVRWATRKKDK